MAKIPIEEMEFKYCALTSTWGPHEGNNGGFMISWGIKNFGFGTTTFVIKKDGTLECDSEACSREFVDKVLTELTKRATLRDEDLPDAKAPIHEDKHGDDDWFTF